MQHVSVEEADRLARDVHINGKSQDYAAMSGREMKTKVE